MCGWVEDGTMPRRNDNSLMVGCFGNLPKDENFSIVCFEKCQIDFMRESATKNSIFMSTGFLRFSISDEMVACLESQVQ